MQFELRPHPSAPLTVLSAPSWAEALAALLRSEGRDAALTGWTIVVVEGGVDALDPIAFRRVAIRVAGGAEEPPPPTVVEPPPVAAPAALAFVDPTAGVPDEVDPTVLPRRSSLARIAITDVAAPTLAVTMLRQEEREDAVGIRTWERSWAAPLGTEEAEGEAFLRARLGELARAAGDRTGVVIALTLYDEIFTGASPLPPLVELLYRDWAGDPEVRFPRRAPLVEPSPLSRAIPLAEAAIAPTSLDDESFLRAATAVPAQKGPVPSSSQLFEAPVRPASVPPPRFAPEGSGSLVARPEGSRVATVPPPGRPGTIPPGGSFPPRALGSTPPRVSVVDELVNALRGLATVSSLKQALAFTLPLTRAALRGSVGYVHLLDPARMALVTALGDGAVEPGTVFGVVAEQDLCVREVLADRRSHLVEVPGMAVRRFAAVGPDATVLVAPIVARSVRGVLELAAPTGHLGLEELRALDYVAGRLADVLAAHPIDRFVFTP